MGPTEISVAAALVLRDLRRADGKEVLKLAIKELVQEETWRLVRGERARRLRAPKRVSVLVPGDTPPPARFPLPRVHVLVTSGPIRTWGQVKGREVRALAEHLAKTHPKIAKELVEETCRDLVRRGLLKGEATRILGLVPRTRYTRTPEGERALEQARSDLEALQGRRQRERDGSSDSSFDDNWDDFDSGFDSSFDSGFSDGGGDGGGGGD